MIKAEKLVRWEKTIVPWIMSIIFFYLIITTSYTIVTGDKIYDIRGKIAVIAGLVVFFIYIFLGVIFPRKYPEEFLKYKRHAQKNLDLRKGKIAAFIVFIGSSLMLFLAIFSWYKFGLEPDLVGFLIFSATIFTLSLFGLYFIRLLEN
jgi:hypothetical protein